jgi:hypothetical protein
MTFDASQIIGSPQRAGVTVLPRGMSKRQASATGGSLAASIALGSTGETASAAPERAKQTNRAAFRVGDTGLEGANRGSARSRGACDRP